MSARAPLQDKLEKKKPASIYDFNSVAMRRLGDGAVPKQNRSVQDYIFVLVHGRIPRRKYPPAAETG